MRDIRTIIETIAPKPSDLVMLLVRTIQKINSLEEEGYTLAKGDYYSVYTYYPYGVGEDYCHISAETATVFTLLNEQLVMNYDLPDRVWRAKYFRMEFKDLALIENALTAFLAGDFAPLFRLYPSHRIYLESRKLNIPRLFRCPWKVDRYSYPTANEILKYHTVLLEKNY